MYALHPVEELERQLREGLPLSPIKEEKTFEVKGLILHMEFLHPPADDQDHVILLAFVIEWVPGLCLFGKMLQVCLYCLCRAAQIESTDCSCSSGGSRSRCELPLATDIMASVCQKVSLARSQ
jgi:hypothetical protein